MNKSPNALAFKSDKGDTAWDSLKNAESSVEDSSESGEIDIKAIMDSVPVEAMDIPDDEPDAETVANYAATDEEIYQEMFSHINQDIATGEMHHSSPEVMRGLINSRDVLLDAYLETTLTENSQTAPTLTEALEKRKAIYDKKLDFYNKLHDDKLAEQNASLAEQAGILIEHSAAIAKRIQDERDPNSNYRKNADAFISDSDSNPNALPVDVIV